ncbi:MAG: hypothetical protein D3908_14555 [Candidatus Electrothrix sp. AUS4]|nr:hypothetical protein [Candidatus Electrothrix sp. AUS4]
MIIYLDFFLRVRYPFLKEFSCMYILNALLPLMCIVSGECDFNVTAGINTGVMTEQIRPGLILF